MDEPRPSVVGLGKRLGGSAGESVTGEQEGFFGEGEGEIPAGREVPSGGDEGEVAGEAIRVGGVRMECELPLVAMPEEGGVEGGRVVDEVFELGGFPGRGRSGLEFGEHRLGNGGIDLLPQPGERMEGDDRYVEVSGTAEEFLPIDGGG